VAERPIVQAKDAQPGGDDAILVARLRDGDEAAFTEVVERYHEPLVRLAMSFVPSRAIAEEVAQDTWLGMLRGLDRFEGRASLRTWLFRILANIARTRGERESRQVPFASVWTPEEETMALEDRFRPASDALAGAWWAHPQDWETTPEDMALSTELHEVIRRAMEGLPPAQREVMRLRDIQGWTSEEVCDVLNITDGNQRVLLHRARTKVRMAIEAYEDGRDRR
jgi:RNA polymerase sigma-70 factor (ECF subfamily)